MSPYFNRCLRLLDHQHFNKMGAMIWISYINGFPHRSQCEYDDINTQSDVKEIVWCFQNGCNYPTDPT